MGRRFKTKEINSHEHINRKKGSHKNSFCENLPLVGKVCKVCQNVSIYLKRGFEEKKSHVTMNLKNTEEKTEILYQKNMRKIKGLLFIFFVPSVCRQDISCLKKSLEIKEEEKTPLRIKKSKEV